MTSPTEPTSGYSERIAAENRHFDENTVVLNLPPIYYYWAEKWILPKLHALGVRGVTEMFEDCLIRHCQGSPSGKRQFVSVGAGNCEMEVDLAGRLQKKGYNNFSIECLELNPAMLARAKEDATKAGVAEYLSFSPTDINHWQALHTYEVVMASQSLHHVVNLEGLFMQIRSALVPGGHFVVSDMIGRNGHLRWPEAMEIVNEFWPELPAAYRYNHQLKRQEDQYQDWDCSAEGFEGIRAQDILPLLLQNFHFELFVAFAGAILPFVDRAFGPNFNASGSWDQDFIDRLHRRDHAEMLAGRVTPSIMCAILGTDSSVPTQYLAPLSPSFCVRDPTAARHQPTGESPNGELETTRRQLADAANSKWLRLGRMFGLGPRLR